MAEMTVDQAQRCLDAMAKSEANTTAFIDIFGEIASLLERQQAEIAKKDRMLKFIYRDEYEGGSTFSDWLAWLEKEAEVQTE